jgi:Dolichyl-phosphate-mannose-protein mannosyltransferase
VTPSNPPGYHRDEAALSYNAYSIATTGRDEDGAVMPLFFRSFGDYKSPLYPYVLAGLFRITGPHKAVARAFSAVLGVLAVLLLGLLARRLTGRTVVVVVVVLAGLTPWLFELGRVALEVATQPLLITLLLVALHRAWRRRSWTSLEGALVGLLLGLLLYSYTGNRLLAPLLAVALAVFAGRGRLRWLLTAWGTFAVFLVPLVVYALRHPGTVTARYGATTITNEGHSYAWIVVQAIANWFHDIDPWFWATSGDPAPYVHNRGYGSLFGAVVVWHSPASCSSCGGDATTSGGGTWSWRRCSRRSRQPSRSTGTTRSASPPSRSSVSCWQFRRWTPCSFRRDARRRPPPGSP